MTDDNKNNNPSIIEFFARENLLINTLSMCLEYFYDKNKELGWPSKKFDESQRKELREYLEFIYEDSLKYYEEDETTSLRSVDANTIDKLIKALLIERMQNLRNIEIINELSFRVNYLKEIIKDLKGD